MKIFLNQTVIFFTVVLFQGCSGHALQDLIDGNNHKTSSDISHETAKDDKVIAPSKNSALQSISPSATAGDDHEEYRYIQKNTNEWIEKEWEPLTEANTENEKKSNSDNNNKHKPIGIDSNASQESNESNPFTLQHYVDKARIYQKNKEKRDENKTKKPSHSEMIETLPGIGSSSKR